MDLTTLLTHHEGKTLEFKRDASSHKGIVRTIVAFANSAGGTLLVGIADRTREVVGLSDPCGIEERIASIIVDSVEPRMAPEIDILPWRDTAVIAVRVHPGSSGPYHVSQEGPSEGVYVRVGSTNRRADRAMIEELERRAAGRSFDEESLPGVRVEDLDLEAAQRALGRIKTLTVSGAESIGLVRKSEGRVTATVGGVLLFGKRRLEWFPDAVIEVARFSGVTRSAFIDSATYDQFPSDALEYAMAFIKRNVSRAYRIEGLRRSESWEYPLVAVRELLVNAVVHADYSAAGSRVRAAVFDDRIEIDSPGLLLPGLTFNDIESGVSRVRNRVMARVFREMGLIEQWGTGIPRAIEACRTAGIAPPEFVELGTGVRVIVRAARGIAAIDEVDASVMAALSEGRGLSTKEIAQRIGRTPRSARDRLKQLVDAGLVVEIGSSPTDPKRRYFVAEDRGLYRTDGC